MQIKILGTGCAKCKTLEQRTREVVEENNLDAGITKVEDVMDIMQYNVVSTPALVVNEKIAVKGRVPSKEEIKEHIERIRHEG